LVTFKFTSFTTHSSGTVAGIKVPSSVGAAAYLVLLMNQTKKKEEEEEELDIRKHG